jgi:hypothetical protein
MKRSRLLFLPILLLSLSQILLPIGKVRVPFAVQQLGGESEKIHQLVVKTKMSHDDDR